MNDRELMQMALDVMLAAIKAGDWKVDGACDPDYVFEALRTRLAQPIIADEIKDDKTEPAAWIITTELQDGTRLTHPLTGRFKDVQDRCDFGDPIPLYTAPPQREWQGLTDDEIQQILWKELGIGQDDDEIEEFARAIEAKLKEKNG